MEWNIGYSYLRLCDFEEDILRVAMVGYKKGNTDMTALRHKRVLVW